MSSRKDHAAIAFLTIFVIALALTSAGMYLNDELCPASQLSQLDQGHQVTFYEGKYGFYPNGSVDKIISRTYYMMPYTLAIPLMDLPILKFFYLIDGIMGIRLFLTSIWLISLFIVMRYFLIRNDKLYKYGKYSWLLLVIVNIYLAINYPFSMNTYQEVLAIVFLNIIFLSGFGWYAWMLVTELYHDSYQSVFCWIAIMSCSSLLFWTGLLKDHVIVATLILAIVYHLIRLHRTNEVSCLMYIALIEGLLIWIRPEMSIITVPITVGFIFLKYKIHFGHPLFTYMLFLLIGSLPLLLNNFVITHSITTLPIQYPNMTIGNEPHAGIEKLFTSELPKYIGWSLSTFSLEQVFAILFTPYNMAVGLVTILMIPFIVSLFSPYIIYYKKLGITDIEKILATFTISIFLFYLFGTALSFNMHREEGIVPDMRYFSPAYALAILLSLSILSRLFILDYRKLIYRTLIMAPIFAVFIAFCMAIDPIWFATTSANVNRLFNVISAIVLGVSILSFVYSIREGKTRYLEYMIPVMISIPMVWQIFVVIGYNKLYNYPIFIPIVALIHKMVFGV